MAPRTFRARLLLDEGLPLRTKFPTLNARCDVKHVHDLHLGGASDERVYKEAINTGRIVVTFNTRHYQKRVTPSTPSIIALTMQLSTKQMDRKVTALVRRLRPSDCLGRVFKISQSTKIRDLV